MTDPFILRPGELTLGDLRQLDDPGLAVVLDEGCGAAIAAAHDVITRAIAEDRRIYGVNTGFGSLADTLIPEDEMRELQRRLVLSNAVGSGPLLPDRVVRRIVVLKVNALARAHSGVRPRLVEALLELCNAGLQPCIPGKGSVGASGDLAPLAHLAAALIGVGEMRVDGEVTPAAEALARAGLEPVELGPKEGLSMVNGTETSTALALDGLFALEAVFAAALVAGALSVEAALGSEIAFAAPIHEIRGQAGEIEVAAVLRQLLEGSEVRVRAREKGRLQDPYSLRCQPQVMGACLDSLRFAADVLLREANAVGDNPVVFAGNGEILYGGNFHGAPVAMAADLLALVIAQVCGLAERRVALLTDANMSGLPPFLVEGSGLNSGFMAAQIAAAALASETKALAHPGGVDSIPTVANFEDYVSMATYASRRLLEMADNAAAVVAIELLAAAQGVGFHRPLTTSAALEAALEALASRVPRFTEDRFMAPEIETIKELVRSGHFLSYLPPGLLPSAA
jgi:histidine ammonia-lyase